MKNTLDIISKTLDKNFDTLLKEAFGRSLKELREYCGITQRELADFTNIPHQSISVYERGTNAPTITQAYKIAFYFNLTIDDFIIYGIEYDILKEDLEYKSITDKYDANNKD